MDAKIRQRLDQELVSRKLVRSRSQAESFISIGQVKVNGRVATKGGQLVGGADVISLAKQTQYVSRAAMKLESADKTFRLDFSGKTVLDVGSSTGGFTQYALLHGAKKVIAVDVGTDQLHPDLHGNAQIELHEKTDIRNFGTDQPIDMVVGDVSFISLREILPYVASLVTKGTDIVAMVKPQFEAGQSSLKHKGVIKNDRMRRDILKDFEIWAERSFRIVSKADSSIPGGKGNVERFYVLRKLT